MGTFPVNSITWRVAVALAVVLQSTGLQQVLDNHWSMVRSQARWAVASCLRANIRCVQLVIDWQRHPHDFDRYGCAWQWLQLSHDLYLAHRFTPRCGVEITAKNQAVQGRLSRSVEAPGSAKLRAPCAYVLMLAVWPWPHRVDGRDVDVVFW